MTFTESIKTCLRKYATFSGRASRSEFWWFMLFVYLAWFILVPTVLAVGGSLGINPFFVLSIAMAITFVSWWLQIAVAVRRLHDIGYSGLRLVLLLVPLLGPIILIGWWSTPGHKKFNEYGEPLGKDGLPIACDGKEYFFNYNPMYMTMHAENCSSRPTWKNVEAIGRFQSDDEAFAEVKRRYTDAKVRRCDTCC